MINNPPLNSAIPVLDDQDQNVGNATWNTPWGNWFTLLWTQISYWLIAPVKTVTLAYQAKLSDSVILINGNITVTLPTAQEGKGKRITCKAINAGGGTRTVSGNGSNIDGAATWTTTTQYASVDLVSDGVQWWAI